VSVFEFNAASNPHKKKHLPLTNNALGGVAGGRAPGCLPGLDVLEDPDSSRVVFDATSGM